MTFEDFLKGVDEFSAEKARKLSQAKTEQTKIDAFKRDVTRPEFKAFIEQIKKDAEKGLTNSDILPTPMEYIEEYTKANKVVPEDKLKFTNDQYSALSALNAIGYVVSLTSGKFYAEGMNQMFDAPLECEYAKVYWGIN